MGQLDSKLDCVNVTTLKIKSPLGTMLTLYLFIVVKDERYFKLKGTIFLVVIVGRKIPVFSERKMDTSGCEQQ